MKVLYWPTKVLNTKVEQVDPAVITDLNFQDTLDEMIQTMDKYDGVGLSANQVGIPQAMFVLNLREKDSKPEVFINPQFISEDKIEWASQGEGCLSIPGFSVNVERESSGTIKYLDRAGNPQEEKVEGMRARAILHEIQHLEGFCIVHNLTDRDIIRTIKVEMIRRKALGLHYHPLGSLTDHEELVKGQNS